MYLNEWERRVYKDYRSGGKSDTDEQRYGGNFEVIEYTYYQIYYDYFVNLLINLIDYTNTPPQFDGRYLEFLLRSFGYARIGATDAGNIFVINANNSANNVTNGLYGFLLDTASVANPISKGTKLTQVTRGNYETLVKNKVTTIYTIISNKYNYYYGTGTQNFTDFLLAERVAKTLGKIKASSMFNINQMKLPFIGFSNNKNLTAKNVWKQINEGKPFINIDSDLGDLKNCVDIFNINVPNFLPQLKDEWNNNLTEFLTILGINNIGVDKKERLLTNEVNANSQLIEASGNIYLEARNNQLQLINDVLGTNIQAEFNQESYRQLVALMNQEQPGQTTESGENNE